MMSWDDQYTHYQQLWGDKPSELAFFTVACLRRYRPRTEGISIIDIGCGYGRDLLYLSKYTRCRLVGIDSSAQAVKMAGANCIRETLANIELKCCSFTDLAADKFDVVYISNLYQLLKPNERQELQRTIQKVLQPNGLVFLSTLSVNDPEHYGKGTPAVDDKDSFVDEKYLHFCTRLELKHDFNFLDIIELYECWYEEPHASGQSHHHVSWILVGVGKPSVIAESSH